MSEPIFMFDSKDPAMQEAYRSAQRSFRYFWRELFWERRRIVPGLDMAMVKLPFTDGPRTDGNGEYEQMWIGDVAFNGDSVGGTLLNSPNWLSSVREGDVVTMPFENLTDWLMTSSGQAYGGFTVNLMRSRMTIQERAQHDAAWGLDFGNPGNVQVEIQRSATTKSGAPSFLPPRRTEKPQTVKAFADHPMCVNSLPKIEAQLQEDRSLATSVDEDGWTLLHHEALAGNLGVAKLLVAHGADASARTPNGYTAGELARKIGWAEVAAYLRA